MEKRFLLLTAKGRFFFIMALLFALSLLLPASPSFSQTPVRFRIASMAVGGSFYIIATGMAEVLKKVLPPGSDVDVLPYAAGVGNPKLVGTGGAEIGMANNVTSRWAYSGKFAYDKSYTNLRALLGGYDSGWLAVMMHPKAQLNSFDEIKEKKSCLRLMVLPPGTLGTYGANQLFEAYGISVNDLKAWGGSVTETSFEVIQNAFQDGRADCWIHVPSPATSAVTELALTTGIKFMPLKEEVIKVMSTHGWVPSIIPVGIWKVDKAVPTVGYYSNLITTKDFPDDLAYLVTKTLLEKRDDVAKVYAGFKQLDPKTAWTDEKNRIPLHPGAMRYYKEKNLMP